MEQMGDHPRARNASTETLPTPLSANAATQVQTVAEVKPVEMLVSDAPKVEDKPKNGTTPSDLQAWFESESTPDGTKFAPNRLVSQSWTLRNPGPHAWPAGCAVYYIGGDDMRNLDANHPSSVSAMASASRSNVLEDGLEAGKTAVFKVMLKSPPCEGRFISYWRLKTPEGVPFGHKLWVDITVTSTPVELPERHPPRQPSPKSGRRKSSPKRAPL
jgi:next-to-BRCA1 protein 1